MANGGACDRRSAIITFLGLLFLVIIVTWTLWNAQHSPLVKSTDPIIVDPPIIRPLGNDTYVSLNLTDAEELLPNLHFRTFIKNRFATRELPQAIWFQHFDFFTKVDELIGEYPKEAIEAVVASFVLGRIHEIGEKYEEINKGTAKPTNALVNAFNSYSKIQIMWGMLAPPFYSANAALEMKYGGVGFIVGHELGHTIDPNNIRRARPVLIGEEDEQQFWEQVECIQHQYEKETLPMNSMNHTFNQPGDLTHDETVADNVGLRSSFRAYRKERKRLYGKLEPKLPGLDRYTPDQVYFIAAAMFWCGEMSDQRLTQYLENAHPPGVFRVNEMMKNSMEFAQAYKCPLNSPMNPAKKCR
ncbi:unnamed protein product, partial [Mesorhabditis spiculigera]